jgi:hypothetical protein
MMNRKLSAAAWLLGSLVIAGPSFADCPGPFLRDAKRAYEQAKSAESAGRKEVALYSYKEAQGSVCEGANPYEADAAKRAAPLGLELGSAAEKQGDLDRAFQRYEAGGHYAPADRVLIQIIRANPDSPGAYQRAEGHFRNRAEGWFTENNAVAIKAAGGYSLDPKFIAEVKAMPAKGVERAIQKEAAAFNEQYLKDVVQAAQSGPDDLTDVNAIQRGISAQQAIMQKWKNEDLVKTSREALRTLRSWSYATQDKQLQSRAVTKVAELKELRATTLRQKYSGAPKLLEEAMDYYRITDSDDPKVPGQLAAVRSQAMKLGDEANSKQRYSLAIAYYEAADADDKADAIREKQQQLAMQKMQPSIDQARKQAEAMQKEFSDPAKVEAMRKQAEAMQKQMQQQQAASKEKNKKSADDLEKELGL